MHPYDLFRPVRKRLHRMLLDRRFKSIGSGVSYDPTTSIIRGYEMITLGEGVYIGPGANISADGVPVEIGADTVIGPSFILMAGDHEFGIPGLTFRESSRGVNEGVSIGVNVWIGARVTVLKGVSIGRGSVVGAGSVVVTDLPPNSIAVGNPARVVRARFSGSEERIHKEFLWARFGDDGP